MRFLAVPLVIVVVAAGIWVTGGKITNDFAASMVLTGAWMAAAGLACLLVAIRRPSLRVPVLGAYVLIAVVAGVYLGRSMLFDDEVNERVARAAPLPPGAEPTDAAPRNLLLRRGRFESVAHSGKGVASTIELARGGRVLTLTDFDVAAGPDLRVYLVAGDARSEGAVENFRDLGSLKGNKGNQQYELPPGVDLGTYRTVAIWCRAFSVLFARAPLREPA